MQQMVFLSKKKKEKKQLMLVCGFFTKLYINVKSASIVLFLTFVT